VKRGFGRLTLSFLALLLVGAGLFLHVHAQTASDITALAAANQLYEDGRFEEAAIAYQKLVDAGIKDDSLFYNLGNAYFKQQDIGRAILYYQRAARLNPRDDDIRANLELARAQAKDKIDADEAAISRLVVFARSWLTLNETAAAALGLWFLLVGLFLAYRHSRSGTRREGLQYALILAALLLAGGLFSFGSRLYIETLRPQSVILADEVDVVSGPGDQYITEFTLHSGAEVSRIETRDDWARIALPGDQFQGWIPVEAMSMIDG